MLTARLSALLVILVIAADRSEQQIEAARLVQTVQKLCDLQLKGRMALDAGGRCAAELIAKSFHDVGLVPLDETGFLRELRLVVDQMEKDIYAEGQKWFYEMHPAGMSMRKSAAVIGQIPGRSRGFKEQVVLVVARYDASGCDGTGAIYPGADRNASGLSVLIEVARALVGRPGGVHRTVLFAALPGGDQEVFMSRREGDGGFEKVVDEVLEGLVESGEWDIFLTSDLIRMPRQAGTQALIANPPVALGRLCAVVDLNMLGRELALSLRKPDPAGEREVQGITGAEGVANPRIAVIGGESGEGLTDSLKKACGREARQVLFWTFDEAHKAGFKGASECGPFLHQRIPSLWITTGPQPEHGTPGDSAKTIVAAQLERAGQLGYRIVKTLANESHIHAFTAEGDG